MTNLDNILGFTPDEMERYERLMDRINSGTYRLSPSSLRTFLRSPRHFVFSKVIKEPKKDAAKKGILVEDMVLNGGETKMFIFDPEQRPDKTVGITGKANQAWKKELFESKGDYMVTPAIWEDAVKMADAVRADKEAMALIDAGGVVQEKIEWEYMGEKLIGFIDIDLPQKIVDFKTCPDAHYSKFRWKINDKEYNYAFQLKSYQIGKGGNKECSIIAVDGNQSVSVFDISLRALDIAEQEIKQAIEGWKRCRDENLWLSSYSFWSPNGRYKL